MYAVVMHSISDHSLNLPSKTQVENYLNSLNYQRLFESGNTCTEPIVIQINKARVSGLAFDKVALLMLSLAPYGMEDVPEVIRKEVESYAKIKGFSNVLIIDTHNSMGKHLDEDDSSDILKACKVALDELVLKLQYNFKFGFCHSTEIGASANDIGPAGMSVMAIQVNDKSFAIGWADSNNMARGLREHIVEHLATNNISMLEICTSDTHYTSGKARNLTGYFTFGNLSSPEAVSKWYLEMAKRAFDKMENASYEVSQTSSEVKVMGTEQFSDYSNTLDRALNITKVFVGITVAVYIAMLIL
jgi:putative membrane protein